MAQARPREGKMAIRWTEDLAVGITEIDDRHKELFDRIDLLFEACNQGKGKTRISATIAFLEEYVETHFNAEEQYMVKTRYPDYGVHKQQHGVFRKNLSEIKDQLVTEGPGIHVIIMTNHMVIDWLKNHIRTRDAVFGAYFRDRKRS